MDNSYVKFGNYKIAEEMGPRQENFKAVNPDLRIMIMIYIYTIYISISIFMGTDPTMVR